jgi:hypothetical protein
MTRNGFGTTHALITTARAETDLPTEGEAVSRSVLFFMRVSRYRISHPVLKAEYSLTL